MIKCCICDEEVGFETVEDHNYGMVMNDKTEGRIAHGKCYEDKFGVEMRGDMKTKKTRT